MNQVDFSVFEDFEVWSGVVPAGYFAYWLGNVTRSSYWAFSDEVQAYYATGRFEQHARPDRMDDNTLDWAMPLEAVKGARDCFRMIALGAGWGRWLVCGAFAAKQKGLPFYLTGVEAEPKHYEWMLEHLRDNGIDPADHNLINAAVSDKAGDGWFYFGDSAAWYGQSLIKDLKAEGEFTEYNGLKAMRVATVPLADIIGDQPVIDYLHMDIQGAEYDVLQACAGLLGERVKRILIGTHSHEIEDKLRKLFAGGPWYAQYDIPMDGYMVAGSTRCQVGDGCQAWINTRLA